MAPILQNISEYDADRFSHNYPPGIENYFWSLARVDLVRRSLNMAAANGLRSKAGRILEIGCAVGVVISGLRKAGFDVWGVDLGFPTPLSDVEDRIRVGINAQDLERNFRGTIETLMFLDVIEHIEDEIGFFNEILRSFPHCTCVIITVPASPKVWSKWDDYYGHYRRYTANTLTQTVRRSGLIPQHTRYFFRSLYAAGRLFNMLGFKRSTTIHPPKTGSWLHRTAAKFLILEDKFLCSVPIPGLSLICIASPA